MAPDPAPPPRRPPPRASHATPAAPARISHLGGRRLLLSGTRSPTVRPDGDYRLEHLDELATVAGRSTTTSRPSTVDYFEQLHADDPAARARALTSPSTPAATLPLASPASSDGSPPHVRPSATSRASATIGSTQQRARCARSCTREQASTSPSRSTWSSTSRSGSGSTGSRSSAPSRAQHATTACVRDGRHLRRHGAQHRRRHRWLEVLRQDRAARRHARP